MWMIAFIILVLVVLGGAAVWVLPMISPSYYAVYLDTGDLYFGKLSRFPRMTLTDVWYLQRDGQNQSLALSQFSKVVWGPENKMTLDDDKVVWVAKVSKDSQILPMLKGDRPAAAQQQGQLPAQQQPAPQQQPQGQASTTPANQ